MSWKNEIGNLLSGKGCYRLEYLYKNCLEPALREICDYLNEFNGMEARLDHYSKKDMSERGVVENLKTYRLNISYPMDTAVYGKGMDPLNRKFIADIYFINDRLVLEIRYRRYGGPFLFQYSPEKEAMKAITESEGSESTPEEKMKKWAEDIAARDVYREELNMNEVLEPGLMEKRLMELYAEHLKHVEFTNR